MHINNWLRDIIVQHLNLSGTPMAQANTGPPSCATPREPTIYDDWNTDQRRWLKDVYSLEETTYKKHFFAFIIMWKDSWLIKASTDMMYLWVLLCSGGIRDFFSNTLVKSCTLWLKELYHQSFQTWLYRLLFTTE